MITPPVGPNVLVVKSLADDIPVVAIFKGFLSVLISILVGPLLIIALPDIALLLRNSMFN